MACRKLVHLCPKTILPRETDTVGILRAISRIFAKKVCLESEKLSVLSARQTESDCPPGHAHLGDMRKARCHGLPEEPSLGQAALVKLPEWGGENNAII